MNLNDPVFHKDTDWECHGQSFLAGWYFWDECWLDAWGPYPSEKIARKELRKYCRLYLGTK